VVLEKQVEKSDPTAGAAKVISGLQVQPTRPGKSDGRNMEAK